MTAHEHTDKMEKQINQKQVWQKAGSIFYPNFVKSTKSVLIVELFWNTAEHFFSSTFTNQNEEENKTNDKMPSRAHHFDRNIILSANIMIYNVCCYWWYLKSSAVFSALW